MATSAISVLGKGGTVNERIETLSRGRLVKVDEKTVRFAGRSKRDALLNYVSRGGPALAVLVCENEKEKRIRIGKPASPPQKIGEDALQLGKNEFFLLHKQADYCIVVRQG
ncbi:MAG: hypothetical protein N3E51_01755 [Candidatus Micrarchaeota archaeon]|nr:hypothetical protein [Candidatus Micrarchaeota archaeon]